MTKSHQITAKRPLCISDTYAIKSYVIVKYRWFFKSLRYLQFVQHLTISVDNCELLVSNYYQDDTRPLWSITKYRNIALVSKVKIQNIYLSIFSVPNLYSYLLPVYYRTYFYHENLYRICTSLISIGGR